MKLYNLFFFALLCGVLSAQEIINNPDHNIIHDWMIFEDVEYRVYTDSGCSFELSSLENDEEKFHELKNAKTYTTFLDTLSQEVYVVGHSGFSDLVIDYRFVFYGKIDPQLDEVTVSQINVGEREALSHTSIYNEEEIISFEINLADSINVIRVNMNSEEIRVDQFFLPHLNREKIQADIVNEKVVISDEKHIEILDLNSSTSDNIYTSSGEITTVNVHDNRLFFADNSGVFEYNQETNEVERITFISGSVPDILLYNSDLYVLLHDDRELNTEVYALGENLPPIPASEYNEFVQYHEFARNGDSRLLVKGKYQSRESSFRSHDIIANKETIDQVGPPISLSINPISARKEGTRGIFIFEGEVAFQNMAENGFALHSEVYEGNFCVRIKHFNEFANIDAPTFKFVDSLSWYIQPRQDPYVETKEFCFYVTGSKNEIEVDLSDNVSCLTAEVKVESKDVRREENAYLYPNPFHDILYFNRTEDVSMIEIFDIMGKRIATIQESDWINTSSWVNGAYVVKMEYNDHTYSSRIFIKE